MNDFSIFLISDTAAPEPIFELQEGATETPEIRETDSISFKVIAKHRLGEPTLFIQDHPIALSVKSKSEHYTEYVSEHKRHLINHFGLSSTAIYFKTTDTLFRVTPLNTVATKINKEQAEKILGYLSSKMGDVTKICFSKTQLGSDSQHSESIDTLTKLSFTRKVIESIHASRSRFLLQPCKSSTEQLKITPYDDNSHITDKEIDWLFQHLDQLYPTHIDASKVSIQNRHYSIDKIQRTILKPNTDQYENQVIYGFLLNLKKFLLGIPDHFRSYKPLSKHTGFFTFDSILQTIEKPLLERRHREATTLVHQCEELISFFELNLPCKNKGVLRPRLTPQAKRYAHYEKTFRLIDEWYNLGQPKWSGVNYLFGMKSLDKLYEFFCLYKFIDCLKDAGYTLLNSETRTPERTAGMSGLPTPGAEEELSNFYQFKSSERTLKLYYEPTIWSFSEHSYLNELVDIYHQGEGLRSCWTPDFVLRSQNNNGDDYFFIFDAKYSDHSNTKDKHLPEIINKYYLKTRKLSSSGIVEHPASIKGVYAFIPKTFMDEYGYHQGPFNIQDKLPSAPFFGYVKLSPGEEKSFNNLIKSASTL